MALRTMLLAALALAGCHDEAGGRGARDRITAVGSSTVYPFTAIVAERFVTDHPGAGAPVIESTGTGAGIRLFCAGIGAERPDIVDASRRMTQDEYRDCRAHGVADIVEMEIGIDGIAFARAGAAPPIGLSEADLYLALAASPGGRPNASRTWRDVDPALPPTPIHVYGPPATSGTRDALAELILARGCEAAVPRAAVSARGDPAAYRALCMRIREDGAYADAGENDNLIVQKLRSDPDAIGVFGYSYLDANRRDVTGIPIDGIMPGYAAIADGRYPGARPLYVYAKVAHLHAVPMLATFLQLYAANIGPDGPLVRRGLIAASPAVRARAVFVAARAVPLDPRVLG